ncbi:hypothetical protein GCM10009715_10270 [Paeniglutamicibacter psychrophenolicus]|uniref:Uncharacterized protein n=1 Tax=Paeniglutamicibacter psychrophenolicus TaxID=257454 RepID=A0ABS4WGQ3_9MICC|nr:hypothetical protein [Paeniglutamicibacter psychrophenolicus]MBP2375128.1 hypothetical protein [Paeniglutamicibacter psychrophenolicus]
MNTSLVAESFLRHEPADGTAAHLVSIQRDPERAAAVAGTRGAVQLRYHSLQLVPVDLVDDLPGIWNALLDAVEGFLADGKAEVPYPSLEAQILLERTGNLTKFTAGKVRHIVDAGELVDGILGGAQAYFGFAADAGQAAIGRIEELHARAADAGLCA